MSRTFRLVAFVAIAALLAGCPKKPPRPTPADTALGPSGPSSGWIDPTTIYGEGAEGMAMRDDSFTQGGIRDETILQDVYFDFNRVFIKDSERAKLMETADYLRQNPNTRLLVEGRCDWRGTREYNLALGDRRANSVKQYLVQLGVDPTRIETLSHGDLDAEENATETQMRLDRRCDLVVLR